MTARSAGYLIATGLLFGAETAHGAALQVAPVLLDVRAGATATLSLRNESPRPIDAQTRVFRWTQANGEDVLEPTEAVVASPPSVTLSSRVDYTVRIVRATRQALEQEEAYRLLVDELPDVSRGAAGTVALVLRHSIPVFFAPQDVGEPRLVWSAQRSGGRLTVTLRNDGARRVRLSRMRVSDGGGASISFGDGLVGYALAGSTMRWTRPAPRGFSGGEASISATGDIGPINASARITADR